MESPEQRQLVHLFFSDGNSVMRLRQLEQENAILRQNVHSLNASMQALRSRLKGIEGDAPEIEKAKE